MRNKRGREAQEDEMERKEKEETEEEKVEGKKDNADKGKVCKKICKGVGCKGGAGGVPAGDGSEVARVSGQRQRHA